MLASLLVEAGGARDALRSIVEANLPARGLAHVISVRAVALNLDARWGQKREGVWEFVGRTQERRAPGAMCVQLNEVDFLIAFPAGEPAAAAARCIDIVRDVLQHYLGRTDQVQQWVRAVPTLEAGLGGPDMLCFDAAPALAGRPSTIEPDRAASRPARPAITPLGRQAFVAPWAKGPAGAAYDQAEWTATSGEAQRTAIALRPVWSLPHDAVSSFRLYRGFNPITVGYGADRERLDLAVLDFATGPTAVGFLQQGTFLHLPVAVSTLLLHRTRMGYLDRLRDVRRLFRQRVVLELEGVDRGVVESRLQELVHVLRPFFRLVLASSTGKPLPGSVLRPVGISGGIIDLASIDEPMNRSALLAHIARARKELPVVVVHGLYEGEVEHTALRAAGASHTSSRPGGRMGHADDLERPGAVAAEAAELARVAGLIKSQLPD